MLIMAIIIGIAFIVVAMSDALLNRDGKEKVVGLSGTAIVIAVAVFVIRAMPVSIPAFWASLMSVVPMLVVLVAAIFFIWNLKCLDDGERERAPRRRRGRPHVAPWTEDDDEEEDSSGVKAPWD
ncbi:hypothetical protein IKG64_00020 [Candidatus Saccharibacteria bacterium]|nr:hypothetical protein [Candidatus Saccharibacteria bacterium]